MADTGRGDVPGARFAVDAAKLPKPFASGAAANSARVVARPRDGELHAPPGFKVSVFADQLSDPRWMAIAPNGDVLVAESDTGRITLLRDDNGDGKAETRSVFLEGFHQPHGLAFHDGALYVADTQAVWRVPYKPGALQAGAKQRISRQAYGGGTGHFTRDIAFAPDGALFVTIGSENNVDEHEPATRASVQQVLANGRFKTLASGLRNPVGIAFYPGTSNLYVTVNERDGYGEDLVPDFLTRIQAGDFFGWPYAYIGAHADPTYGSKRPDLVARTKTPDVLFQAHSAPLGLVFYEGSQFPAEYRGNAFVALHGSWNRATPTGYKVVRVKFTNGKPKNAYENFLTGFWVRGTDPAEVIGRPAGLAVAKDGSLLVADDAGKTVWRVSYAGE